jgi:hypothetical protein
MISIASPKQAAEKRPSVAFPSSFVAAAYIPVRLTPQDCLPDRQVKSAAGALHLGIFDQPEERILSTISKDLTEFSNGASNHLPLVISSIVKEQPLASPSLVLP